MSTKTLSVALGFTLIELIVFIVIVSVGLTGVLASLNISVKSSADPLQPKQALAIAEATLESMLLRNYADLPLPFTAPSSLPTGYTPTVTVTTAGVFLDTIPATRILVSVSTPSSGSYTLTGYRTDY
jgi:type II secretory pathway pseudopilin PulG